MFPRILVSIVPLKAAGVYRVRVSKGWWKGPGHGATVATLAEFECELRDTDERDRIRTALRAAADSLD